ncbi:MAG: hypothetical protein ACYC7D_07055 [Nitrososphaerales archaeon]
MISFVPHLDFDLSGGKEQDQSAGFKDWIVKHLQTSPEYIESLSATEFVDRLQTFLCQSGFRKLSYVKTDGKKIYAYHSENQDDITLSFAQLRQKIEGSTTVEVAAATKTEQFAVWINIKFSSKHREKEYSMAAQQTCVPNNLMKLDGESEYRYAERLEPFTAGMSDKAKKEAYLEREKEILVPLITNYGDNLARKYYVSVEKLDIEQNGMVLWTKDRSTKEQGRL